MSTSIIIVGIVIVIGTLSFSWVIADHAMSKGASIPGTSLRRDKRWRRQLAYRVPLIAIAITPLVILDATLLTAQFQTITYSNLSSAQNPALENLEYCPDSNGVELTVAMRDLDSAQETADADLSLCIGDQVLRNLTVVGSGARPLSHGISASGLSPSFLQSTFRVSYLGSTPETSLTRTVTIQSILEQSDPSGGRGPVDLGVVSIPIFGNAISYPLDSYSATGLWDVSLPVNMEDVTSNSIGVGWTGPTNVVATPNAGNIAWRFAGGPDFTIQANRVLAVKVFVLLISILPLLLFFGLLALLRQFMSEPNRDRFPVELVVGVGAFLLAIIPTRAVLVPSDISQTTVVDYILGTEMAVMVASSLMIVLARSVKPVNLSMAESEVLLPQGTTSLAATSGTVVNDRRSRQGLIGAILLGMTGAVVITKFRQLLNRARKTDLSARPPDEYSADASAQSRLS